MGDFASICILSFNRPSFLRDSLTSLHMSLDYPAEIILHDDGSTRENSKQIQDLLSGQWVSYGLFNYGQNLGIANAFAVSSSLARGKYIIKADQDLVYKPGWLSKAVKIMERDPEVGCLSLFNYRHYDPDDTRFNILEDRGDHYMVDDFVSSIYLFRAVDLPKIQPIQADGNHSKLPKLAITSEDLVTNQGFGPGPSTYVLEGGGVQGHASSSLIFRA